MEDNAMSDSLDPQPKRSLINMTSLDFIANGLAFLCVVMLAWTGLFVFDELKGPMNRVFWGIDRHAWHELHERLGVLLVLLIGYHLVRHRRWISSAFEGRLFGEPMNRTRTWTALCVALVGFVLFVASSLF
jgi:hypothetical protein